MPCNMCFVGRDKFNLTKKKEEEQMSLSIEVCTPADRPIIATITGDAGLGKTTLAATFPKPIFIRAEDGLQSIPIGQRPDAFPIVHSVADLWAQLKDLCNSEHDYETLIIDSVTALERLFTQHVLDSDPRQPKSMNQALGGYGAGLGAVATMHQRVRKACGYLNEKKAMHIVFIAHADTETIELPDQEPYTRYSLRLGKRSQAPYTDDSDLVGFIKLQTMFKAGSNPESKKKAISDGTRVIDCQATASSVSGNRYGITEAIRVEKGVNPFIGLVTSLTPEIKPTQQEGA